MSLPFIHQIGPVEAEYHLAPAGRELLPVVVGLGFAAGLPAAMALGKSGPLALAVLWGAVAAALAAPRRRLPGHSATPAVTPAAAA